MKATPLFSSILDPAELDDLEQLARRNHISFRSLELIYQSVLDKRYVSYSEVLKQLEQSGINIAPKTLGKYVAALKMIGDISVSFEFSTEGYDGRWLVYSPGVISDLCKKRHISLLSFMRMQDIWDSFYSETDLYFDCRQKRIRPPETLTSIKERYMKIVAKRGHNGTSHKFVRTALDQVVLAFGDMRRVIANAER